jgi:hypothetical protein
MVKLFAERSAGTQIFNMAANDSNGKAEIYISFFAENRLSVSDSTWINNLAD